MIKYFILFLIVAMLISLFRGAFFLIKDGGTTKRTVNSLGGVLGWLPLWNTVLLLTSSLTVHIAHLGLKNGNRKQFNLWLGITLLLGYAFVVVQGIEYYEAYTHYGLTLNTGIYGTTFFMLTGFHGFHVCLGAIILTIMLFRSSRTL